jgi:hypothetical protein
LATGRSGIADDSTRCPLRLECGGCGKEILPKDADYYRLGNVEILKPCRECTEKAKKALEMYPKNHGKKA